MPDGATQAIRVSLKTLEADPESVRQDIEDAFGSKDGCLGVILVSDLPPEFAELREKLFFLIHQFAQLPEHEREKLARPELHYLFGWSHGKEVMNGRPDTQKGSYYANPLLDRPEVSEELKRKHPEYYAGNVWPTGLLGMDQFESTFKALGKLVCEVGTRLAEACETFISQSLPAGTSVASLISSSKSNKARLLHYYPQEPDTAAFSAEASTAASDSQVAQDALCGTHLDHSLLTGLCSAMYINAPSGAAPAIVPPPDPQSGLYIYPRHARGAPRPAPVKVNIPPDCLAFQTGEALEVLTGGKLAATPHFVSGTGMPSEETRHVSRETFAFFLQPDVNDVISASGETFGQFTKRVIERHYS